MDRAKKKESDSVVRAFRFVREATGQTEPPSKRTQTEKEYNYKAPGYKGGLKGGKARASKLTPEQRKEIARKAAHKRWQTKTL